jgi:hypothetical protein
VGRGWGGVGAGQNLRVGEIALVVPLEFLFCGLKFRPASLRTAAGDCFIAKIMCAGNLLSCEKRSCDVSKTEGILKKTTRSVLRIRGRGRAGESSTRPSVARRFMRLFELVSAACRFSLKWEDQRKKMR